MDFPWPKKGDKAFAPDDQGKFFHRDSIERLMPHHARAFKTAADMIMIAHEASTWNHDELLLPVAFLYRHCLEVKLKDLIWVGIHRQFFRRDKVERSLASHNLAKLWTLVKKLLQDGWPNEDPGPLKGVESVVNQFHQVDPNGQMFRYDREKDTLKQHRHENLPTHIGVANLRLTMDGVYSFLDTCGDMLLDELNGWDRDHY